MSSQETEQTVNVLASARLTEAQVQTALLEFLLKNDELKELIVGKGIGVSTQWQTSKWSDPDALVHIVIAEDSRALPVEAETEEETSSVEENPLVTETVGTPSKFFKESK